MLDALLLIICGIGLKIHPNILIEELVLDKKLNIKNLDHYNIEHSDTATELHLKLLKDSDLSIL